MMMPTMDDAIHVLLDELHRLKRNGVTAVSVSDEALRRLRDSAGRAGAPASPPPRQSEDATAASHAQSRPDLGTADSFREILAAASKPPRATTGVAPGPETGEAGSSSLLPPAPVVELPAGTKRERWEWLRNRVLECPVCRAHTHGNFKVVFGVGNIDADIFFCGEAPGGEEEVQGEPFVGPAGQMLNRMIGAMALRRGDVYIGNILNWRPEVEGRLNRTSVHQVGNRAPTNDEMRFGLPYLRAQVEVVQPKVIVALGSTAAEGLLGFGSFKTLGAVRGRWHAFNGIPLMVTYHPSYLLRNASNRTKRVVWEDLLLVMEKTGLPISEKQRGYFL
jgi:DNA polymerase